LVCLQGSVWSDGTDVLAELAWLYTGGKAVSHLVQAGSVQCYSHCHDLKILQVLKKKLWKIKTRKDFINCFVSFMYNYHYRPYPPQLDTRELNVTAAVGFKC
jgi:hypothetical protein